MIRAYVFLILCSAALSAVNVCAQVVSTMPGSLNASGNVSVDTEGNIYIADYGVALPTSNGMNVFKMTPEGMVSIFASGFNGASGNAFDSEGNLFQSNIGLGAIMKITPAGVVSTYSTGHVVPIGVEFDSEGNLFVSNCGANRIDLVTPDGASSVFAASTLLNCPNGMAIDNDNNIYTVNFGDGWVIKTSRFGEVSRLAFIPGNNNGHVTFANGVLYVVARSAHQIYQVTLDGDVSLLAGSGMRGKADGSALEAEFSLPNGIDASPTGDTLYVNDMVSSTDVTGLNPVVVRRIILSEVVSVEENRAQQAPIAELLETYPNPFIETARIRYQVSKPAFIAITILDPLGRKISQAVNEWKAPGAYTVEVDLGQGASGMYFCRLQAGEHIQVQRLQALR